MTTIAEDVEGEMSAFDFSQLLDPDTTLPGTTDSLFGTAAAEPCPIHPDAPNCACNAFLGDWALPEPVTDPLTGMVEEPDYSRFENWIPRFVRPEKPCDYCRSRRLQCYVQRGEPHCTPCATLFRECSLTNSNTLEANNYVEYNSGNFLDTLHAVDENSAIEKGTLTGIKTLRSNVSHNTTREELPGSSKRNGIRFPRHAVKTLRDWLDAHADNPYPTEEEKADLERQTELKPAQIANWLANARRRRKVTEKARPKLCMSPSLRPSTAPIDIPSSGDKSWEELNPFERWKNSPPENEPANMLDIANAVANSELPESEVAASPSTIGRSSKRRKGSSTGSGWSNHRAPSTTSAETGRTSSLSASSAALSNQSSHSTHGSFGSFSSSLAGKKDRRRRRKPSAVAPGRKLSDDRKRIFQCTFCTDTFKSKYDWTRHEKSLHLSLEKWICAPLGPVITDQESGNKQCVYCDLHNPSSDHIESHNHRQCEDKGLDARTFYRKDHLRQHLRLMHGCEMTGSMDSWKSIAVNINSRCGFCAQRFTKWQDRVDHLTAHFKNGARMSEWKGCRGLDPAVAAQVTNAMPPYLIGIESVSPNPFSATNRATWRQGEFPAEANRHDGCTNDRFPATIDSSDTKATCWEILTVRLGNYAKQMADKGIIMTDEMLQKRARQILYDSDDGWEQTAADNPEWLDLFKKAHGLNFIPNAIGGQGSQVPEDLEAYSDLGLRIPFAVQLQAYNQAQTGQQAADAATRPGPYEQAKLILRDTYLILKNDGALYPGHQKCEHDACADNTIDIQRFEDGSPGHTTRRWCSQALSSKAARLLNHLQATGSTNMSSPSSNTTQALSKLSQVHGNASCDIDSASRNRSQALSSLWDQEARFHVHDSSCGSNDDSARAKSDAIASGLNTLVRQENVCCPWSGGLDSDAITARSKARAEALEAWARAEAPETDYSSRPAAKPYLRRHTLELPKQKANLFATTTGAWEDSGVMPQTVHTTLPNVGENTSTGAMMEFLGGDLGSDLPFSTDALTSSIALPDYNATSGSQWQLPDGGGMTHEEMLSQLIEVSNFNISPEEFIPGMNALDDFDMDWTTPDTQPSNSNVTHTTPNNFTPMEDVNFDDFTFDGVFDMPMDEAFEGAQ